MIRLGLLLLAVGPSGLVAILNMAYAGDARKADGGFVIDIRRAGGFEKPVYRFTVAADGTWEFRPSKGQAKKGKLSTDELKKWVTVLENDGFFKSESQILEGDSPSVVVTVRWAAKQTTKVFHPKDKLSQALEKKVLQLASAERPGEFDIRTADGAVVLAADQVLAYEWASHTLTLKPGVRKSLFAKLKGDLAKGQPFVVAVGGKKVYEGTWKSVSSSSSCATPVIVLDEAAYEPKVLGEDQVRISLGYPSENFFRGEDPRGSPRVLAALKASGRLAKAKGR